MPTLIQLNTPFFFVFMLFLLGLSIAFLFYKKTYPAVGMMQRGVLTALRGLWLATLFFLLLSPVLRLHYSEQRPRNVAVFVDRSASMGLTNRFENRADSLKRAEDLLKSILTANGVRQQWFTFSQTVRSYRENDSLFNGLTDFSPVAGQVIDGAYDDLFIISDGIRTTGEIPASSPVPAYAVGVGDTRIYPDIFIRRVTHAPEIIQNDTARVHIVIGHKAIGERDIVVRMYQGNRLIRQVRQRLAPEGGDVELSLAYVAEKPGFSPFSVEVRGTEQERNRRNNRFSFTQWVRKSQLRIGLMAASPGYDFKFIRQAIAADKYLKAEIYLPRFKPSSRVPWDSLDAVFLIGLPARDGGSPWPRLEKWLAEENVGQVFYLTAKSDARKLSRLSGGEWQIARLERMGEGLITPRKPLTPLMSPFPETERTLRFWEKSAPVFGLFRVKAGEKEALLNGDGDNAFLALARRKGPARMLVNGPGLWRTAFEIQESDPFMLTGYYRFIQGLAHRAASKNREKALSLRADKRVYDSGESILLSAFVYDSRQNGVDNATVEVSAESEGQTYNFNLTHTAPGKYQAAFPAVNAGRYVFRAVAKRGETLLGEDRLAIRVQMPDAEFTHTRQDTAFLKEWAGSSGGAYLTLPQLERGERIPALAPVAVRHKIEIDLKNSMALLIILLSLITLEWLLRKRFNLI